MRIPARGAARGLTAVAVLALALTACGGTPATPTPFPTAATSSAPGPRVLVTGLEVPWGVAFLPDGAAMVDRAGVGAAVRVAPDGAVTPVGTVAGVVAQRRGRPARRRGLARVRHRPHDRTSYFTSAADNRVVRLRVAADGTVDGAAQQVLVSGIVKAGIHNGGAVTFGPDGLLYIGTGDAGRRDARAGPGRPRRQDPAGDRRRGPGAGQSVRHGRLQPRPPQRAGPRVRARRHALRRRVRAERVDEINRITAGGNYGWPEVEGAGKRPGFTDPLVTWPTADASPSGLAFAGGALYAAGLRGERLWRVPVTGPGVVGTPEALLTGEYGRLRAVAPTPDGTALWADDEQPRRPRRPGAGRRPDPGGPADPLISPIPGPGSQAARPGCHAACAPIAVDDLHRERGSRVSDGQNGNRLRRFGWKAFLLAAVAVAMVWLVVAQRARIAESLGLLARANWWWIGAAVVAQMVSMGALARQQRRLLGVGGTRISLAGVIATTYAGNAISVGLPLAGPAAATVFAMKRFVSLGAEPSVAGWALAVSGVFSSFALVAVVALGAVVSGSGLAVVSAAIGVLGGAVPLAVLLLSLRRPGPRRLVERLGTRLVETVQRVSGHPHGDPEEIVQEQLEEVTALEPDRPTLWIAALLAALNWLADAACLAFSILAVGGDVPWEGLLLAWAAGTAVASLGLTPGGLGVVEAALSSALIATGLVGSTAIAAVLVYRIVSLWLVLAAGGLTLLGLGGPKVIESDDRADPARSA